VKEIILVGAEWCGSCKAMKEWFLSLELPGVVFTYRDINEIAANVTTVPVVVFKENDQIVQESAGAMTKFDLLRKAKSIFEE
jgi:thiol-disulfide isomerase/thioredoxin